MSSLARASCKLSFAVRPAVVSVKAVDWYCSLKKFVQIPASSWRGRHRGVEQASFEYPRWCSPHPVCLCTRNVATELIHQRILFLPFVARVFHYVHPCVYMYAIATVHLVHNLDFFRALQVCRPDTWAHIRVPHIQCVCVCACLEQCVLHLLPLVWSLRVCMLCSLDLGWGFLHVGLALSAVVPRPRTRNCDTHFHATEPDHRIVRRKQNAASPVWIVIQNCATLSTVSSLADNAGRECWHCSESSAVGL